MKVLKNIELTITEDEGIDAIALVNHPAIEIDFMKFNREHKSNITFASADLDKQILTGPAMIPDKLIYRYDRRTNQEYNVWFSKDTVNKVSQLYLKEMKQSNVNLEHNSPLSNISLVESWIVMDSNVDKAKALGYDVPIGTWMISMHCTDTAMWNELIKTSDINGFSIEGYFVEKYSEQEKLTAEEEIMIEIQKAIDANDVDFLEEIKEILNN